MKKLIILVYLIIVSHIVCAQKGLLLAYYRDNSSSKGLCTDYGFVKEEVKDYKMYMERRKEIKTQYPGVSTEVFFIKPEDAVIVFNYKKRAAGWNCEFNVYSIIKRSSIYNCQKYMDDYYMKNSKEFATRPAIYLQYPLNND